MPENEGEVTVVAYHPGNNNYLPTTVIMTVFHIAAGETTNVQQLTDEQKQTAHKFVQAGAMYLQYAEHVYDAEGRLVR